MNIENTIQMIEENKTEEEKLQEEERKKILSMELSSDQHKALDLINEFLNDPDRQELKITGYAGTGKTTLVARVLCENMNSRFVLTAPTNKAAYVLMEKSGLLPVDVMTIHQLLGIKMVREKNENNEYEEKFKQCGKSSVRAYNVIFLDEASMVNKELKKIIESVIEDNPKIKIIYLGDLAQLPPVGEKKSLALKNIDFNLSEIIRQSKENPISDLLYLIRQNIDDEFKYERKTEMLNGIGIVHFKSASRFINHCSDFIKDDRDNTRLLAWTNARVKKANKLIRENLYGEDVGQIVKGEVMVANSPVVHNSGFSSEVVINNTEEFVVKDFSEKEIYGFKCYEAYVELKNGAETIIYILDESQKKEYSKKLKRIRESAKEEDSKELWRKFFDYKNKFANVDYSYAMTVHKSQGSTFKKVFVIEDDIMMNKRIYELNRCRYVAFSRASESLYILNRYH